MQNVSKSSALNMQNFNILSMHNREKITPERLNAFNEERIAILAKRLEEDDYATPFEGLGDWHLLRALAIHRPELTSPYLHLVDQEPFDED